MPQAAAAAAAAPAGKLLTVPLLLLQVDGLKDEGKEYAEQLEAAGVRVKFKEYKGCECC